MAKGFHKFLSEEDLTHRAIMDYIHLQFPKAKIAHVANEGKRSAFEQFKIKWLGVSPGVPDILVFTPGKRYSGLAIEVKSSKGVPSSDQEQWLKDLVQCGWMAVWVRDVETAISHIKLYFNGSD